jgi:hypothetical protein
MKRLLILVFVIPFILFACFEKDDPAEPDGNGGETSPYSGSFICSSTFTGSDCNYPALGPASTIDILIDGDVITIESASGVWDDNLKSGTATSAQICVPMPSIATDCVRCADYSFSIEYAHPDSLWGTYTVIFHYSAECGTDECYTTYSIEAVR